MEQVVLKPQNLPKELCLLADCPPAQGSPSISDLMTKAYRTDPLPGKMLEAIRTNSGLLKITVTECTEDNGRLRYRGSSSVPDSDGLHLRIIQKHHDTALAGHLGWVKTFDLLDQVYYWKEMLKDVARYVQNCHDCQRFQSSRNSIFWVLRALPVPIRYGKIFRWISSRDYWSANSLMQSGKWWTGSRKCDILSRVI